MYKQKRWKRKRQYILTRDLYMCQENKRYGRTVEANTVHHIYPVEDYPELAFTDWNLISLSHSEHNKMHDRNTDKITSKGKYWQRQRRREFNKWRKGNEQSKGERRE